MFRRFIAGSNIRTEVLNDTLVLTGTVRNPADSSRAESLAARFANTLEPQNDQAPKEKVINMLVVEGEEQVTLQVKIAEVQREAMKQLGVNLAAGFQNGNGLVSLLTENRLPVTTAEGLVRHWSGSFERCHVTAWSCDDRMAVHDDPQFQE